MSIVVFCGPTLSQADVAAWPTLEFRPPAARGDVLRATAARPDAIGLIDGYFDRVPSVWHKEVLWAMTEGIHVFGAASMGALRAAELSSFGMEGVGVIFEQYRDGVLVDDDEVAVAHTADDRGYQPVSEALVNVRATLSGAVQSGCIDAETCAWLVDAAKRLPYYERTYPHLLRLAERAGLQGMEALTSHLAAGRVDQKRVDALSLLHVLVERARAGWTRKRVDFDFSFTDNWEVLQSQMLASTRPGHPTESREHVVEEELALAGRAGEMRQVALARALCLAHARRIQYRVDPRAVEGVVTDFRREHGLLEPAQFEDWLERQSFGEDEAATFFEREAVVRSVSGAFRGEALAQLLDGLRASGGYMSVLERITRKQLALAERGLDSARLEQTLLSEDALWRWYFEDVLKRSVPVDLVSYARHQGVDVERLRAAVIREYCFRNLDVPAQSQRREGAKRGTWENESNDGDNHGEDERPAAGARG
jgi:hypothetical protein